MAINKSKFVKNSIQVKTFKVTEEATLFAFLSKVMEGKSRTTLKSILKNRLISVNGIGQTNVHFILKPGDTLTYGQRTQKAIELPLKLDIAYEDQSLIVVNKPEGLLTISSEKEKNKTMYAYLSFYLKQKNLH